jgi:glucose-6-phosphate isomerase
MQLPDETISYAYQNLLFQPRPDEEWRPALELQSRHFLDPHQLREVVPQVLQVRGQIAGERTMAEVPAASRPQDDGFIDLPERLLNEFRRQRDQSELARITNTALRLREQADRLVVLGIGGSYMGARALFEALRSAYHNELPADARMGTPRVYFEGNNLDNDSLQDLLDLLQQTCISPQARAERYATIVISKSGGTLETAAALRVFRREAKEFYGSRSEWLKSLQVAVTGAHDSKLRALMKAEGYADEEIFTVPERVGGRFSVFSAVGLLPAAVLGLDIRALLLGAASMTKQFLDEPFERNIPLQFAAVNHLMSTACGKPIRVLAVWSKKLEALGLWYDQLLSESLGKQGKGPTPITAVETRDLHSRGQQHQEGTRDKVITNLIVKGAKAAPIPVGMADRNEDGLNDIARRTYPDLLSAALRGTNEAYLEAARPTADLILPSLSEYTLGQLMQMLMLATVVEGRLLGINPYGQPGVEAYKRNMQRILHGPAAQPRAGAAKAP